jgi:hypothetical protein
MYQVQVIAADGLTRWVRIRDARSETTAAAMACKIAAAEHGRKFYAAAVLPS